MHLCKINFDFAYTRKVTNINARTHKEGENPKFSSQYFQKHNKYTNFVLLDSLIIQKCILYSKARYITIRTRALLIEFRK